MRYLLVGNANVFISSALAARADRVVQINDCVNNRPILAAKTIAVFLINSGKHHERMARLAQSYVERGLFPQATFILPRNPEFYAEKRRELQAAGHPNADAFETTLDLARLPQGVPAQELSYADSADLRARLLAAGMEPHQDASSGMVAYDWIKRRMTPEDKLDVVGFGHAGWRGHPWAVEGRMMAADELATSVFLRDYMPRGLWRRGMDLYGRAEKLLGFV